LSLIWASLICITVVVFIPLNTTSLIVMSIPEWTENELQKSRKLTK
jgi:hypothetical protein